MPSAPRILTFAERHGWKFFVGLGLLYVLFGVSDLSIAVTIDSRQLALALLAIGLLGTAISLTGLRRGERWAWLAMWVFPAHAAVDYSLVLSRPGGPPAVSASVGILLIIIPAIALGLSFRRYFSTPHR
jgi:hypothetical protein